ncbi:MAG: hypothetical protein H6R06_2181 [Proteobacteria bacterium]|jgi:hypothetical protein|nr:hypothetical protein [Pseudomonadota bacterium]
MMPLAPGFALSMSPRGTRPCLGATWREVP